MKFVEHILSQSQRPWYTWIVFILTMCESIFLFIPPEVFMTPPIIADRKRAIPVTVAASLGSLIGGAVAYMIGAWLFDSIGVWIINNFASMEKFLVAQQMFIQHGILIIILAAVTPVPYKLMTICAGFIGFPALTFLFVSGLFRTGRFAVVAVLLYFFQERANAIIKKYFWPLLVIAIISAGLGIILMTLL